MPDPFLAQHTAEFTEIVRHLIRLKPRFKTVLPDDLADVKARLDKSYGGGRIGSVVDYDLFYNLGVILAQEKEPITMGELGRALDVPLSTATRIVNWLVRNDYATRLPDPDDRRIVRVALTEAGQAMYRVGNEFIQKHAQELLSRFTLEERTSLIALLRKLVEALEAEG